MSDYVVADFTSVPRKKRKLCTSCETCKLRRVRCERERDDLPCYKCIDKGIRCITPGPRPRKARTGKRIEHARALFGTDGNLTSQPTVTSKAFIPSEAPSLPDDGSWMWEDEQLVLTDESAESSLSISEMIGQLSSHLIETYFNTLHYPLPLQKWREFRAEFDHAGRRPDQMPTPMSEVLAVILIAYSARVSNAPIIAGRSAPALPDIDKVEPHLIEYGHIRADICSHLKERAILLADERGIFRQESPECIAVLLLLDKLISHGDLSRRKGRAYRTAIVGHVRTIKEEGDSSDDLTELFGGGLGWLVYIRDSQQAGTSGKRPILREDDIETLCGRKTLLDLPTLADFTRALNNQDALWDPIKSVWDHISTMLRRVTILTMADTWHPTKMYPKPVEACIWEVYNHIDATIKCITVLETFILKLSTLNHHGAIFFETYVTFMPLGCFLVLWRAHRAIDKQLQSSATQSSYSNNVATPSFDCSKSSEHEKTKPGLLALYAESNRRMEVAARETTRRLWRAQKLILSRAGLGILTGIHMIYETIPTWAEFLCNLPILEDGVPVDYTLDVKVQEVGWLLQTCRSLGWAYEDMADTIAFLERHHSSLTERQAQAMTLVSTLQPWISPLSDDPSAIVMNPLSTQQNFPGGEYGMGSTLNTFICIGSSGMIPLSTPS